MKPASPDMVETLHRVRQQLILAQVRIMELEDVRDEMTAKWEKAETLLAGAQTLADRKIDESAHLERVRTELQAQYEHMRHMQHVTNEALNQARTQTEASESHRRQILQESGALQIQLSQLSEKLDRVHDKLGDAQKLSESRAGQIAQLKAELAAMRATRSWRWTAWLRSLAGKSGDGNP